MKLKTTDKVAWSVVGDARSGHSREQKKTPRIRRLQKFERTIRSLAHKAVCETWDDRDARDLLLSDLFNELRTQIIILWLDRQAKEITRQRTATRRRKR